MNSIAWNRTIGLPELLALLREREGEVQGPGRRAHRARADHQPLLDEPVLRELVAIADLAEHLVVGHPHALEREDRVLEHERVHVRGGAHEPDARRVLVDQEHGGLRGVAVDVHVQLEEVGDVARGHVPLLAVDHPVVAVAPRGGRDHRRVGAGAFLRDRVGVAPLSADRRAQVPLLLCLGAALQGDRRAPREVPERAGRVPPLLLDQHLLEGVEPLPAVLDGVVDAVEVPVEDRAFGGGVALGREAVVRLALVLEGHQYLLGEVAGLRPKVTVGGGETHVHGVLLG